MRTLESFFTIKNFRLYNNNTKQYEGLPGDTVEFYKYINGEKTKVKATLLDISSGQVLNTKEYGIVIVSGDDVKDIKIL